MHLFSWLLVALALTWVLLVIAQSGVFK